MNWPPQLGVSDMGSIITKKIEIPLPDNYPCPVNRVGDYINYQDGYFRGVEICDESYDKNKKGIVLYFHGSGARATAQSALSDAVNEKGYSFIGINELGYGESGKATYRYGYGNVNLPEFQNRWIKSAWWVKAVMEYIKPRVEKTNERIVILGHSMGAAAAIAYLAGYADFDEGEGNTHADHFRARLQGVFVNGATIGGLGTFTWNDINKNINGMSQMFRLAQDAEVRKLIVYSDNDAYGPPDYVKRLQMALKSDKNTYMVSSGGRGHSWLGASTDNAKIAAQWIDSLMRGQPIHLLDGRLAVTV